MLAEPRDDDRGVLASLALVDADRVRERERVELGIVDRDVALVDAEGEPTSLRVERANDADVAVVDLAIVVVLQLHDLVARAEPLRAADDLGPSRRVERRLERLVERVDARGSLVHRGQHLDVADGIEPESGGDPFGDELDDRGLRGVGIAPRDDEEIAGRVLGRRWIFAEADPVCGVDDEAPAGLTEDRGEADARDDRRSEDVAKNGAGADARELIDVADEHEPRAIGDGVEERARERRVDHRGLVDDHGVGVDRRVRRALEAPRARVDLEEAVDRNCLAPGRLGHPLRRAPGRRSEASDELRA